MCRERLDHLDAESDLVDEERVCPCFAAARDLAASPLDAFDVCRIQQVVGEALSIVGAAVLRGPPAANQFEKLLRVAGIHLENLANEEIVWRRLTETDPRTRVDDHISVQELGPIHRKDPWDHHGLTRPVRDTKL
jgi:hypothetical protein